MDFRTKFMLKGITYDELDREMIPTLNFLNFKVGVKTKFCCFGHEKLDYLYIMFDDEVDYETGERVAEKVSKKMRAGLASFKYWIRQGRHGVIKNWILESDGIKTVKDRYEILIILENSLRQ